MNKFKTTGFWITLSGAVMLVVQTILGAFGITFNSELVSNVVSAICGIFVMVGVLIPTKLDSLQVNLPGLTEEESETKSTEGVVKQDTSTSEINSNEQLK